MTVQTRPNIFKSQLIDDVREFIHGLTQ